LGPWVYARGLIGLNVVLGLAVTACYAAQGLAVAEIIGQVFRGPDWPTILLLLEVVVAIQVIRAGLLRSREVSGTAPPGPSSRGALAAVPPPARPQPVCLPVRRAGPL
jgi:hypothetical protein